MRFSFAVLGIPLVCLLSLGARAQTVVASLPVSAPGRIAINPLTNRIYVAGGTPASSSAGVTVIDGATNATVSIRTGSDSGSVAVNPITNKIYVANSNGTVAVIDGAANAITATIRAGMGGGIAVNPVTNKIYVAGVGSVTVIDGAQTQP